MKYAILATLAFILAGCTSTEQAVAPAAEEALLVDEDERMWEILREAERRRLDEYVEHMQNERRGLRGSNYSNAAPMPFGDGMFGPWFIPAPEKDNVKIRVGRAPLKPSRIPARPKDD